MNPHPLDELIAAARLALSECTEVAAGVQSQEFSDETRARCAEEVRRAQLRLDTLLEAQQATAPTREPVTA